MRVLSNLSWETTIVQELSLTLIDIKLAYIFMGVAVRSRTFDRQYNFHWRRARPKNFWKDIILGTLIFTTEPLAVFLQGPRNPRIFTVRWSQLPRTLGPLDDTQMVTAVDGKIFYGTKDRQVQSGAHLSWPAVSQSCNAIHLPSKHIVFIWKSTPGEMARNTINIRQKKYQTLIIHYMW